MLNSKKVRCSCSLTNCNSPTRDNFAAVAAAASGGGGGGGTSCRYTYPFITMVSGGLAAAMAQAGQGGQEWGQGP